MTIINPTIKNVKRPPYYVAKTKDANNILQKGSEIIDLTGVTGLGDRALQDAYLNNTSISGTFNAPDLTTISGSRALYNAFKGSGVTSVSMPLLKTVTGYIAFYETFMDCTGLTGTVNLGSLETVDGEWMFTRAFQNTAITGIDLHSLKTINGNTNVFLNAFDGCNGLTGVIDLSSVETIVGSNACRGMFQNCLGITGFNLSSLTSIDGQYALNGFFYNSPNVTNIDLSSLTNISTTGTMSYFIYNTFNFSISFPSLKTISGYDVFNYMCYGSQNAIVHFPKNLEGLWSFNMSGTNTIIAYDLPSTYTLTGADSVTYTRNPKYDTATALAWKVGAYGTTNFDPAYYTSGTTDPQVSDTIYSDSACTVAVTTIDSIA